MRVAIDVTALLPQMTGVDNYLVQLVLNLAKVDQRNEYLIVHNREDCRLFADRLPRNFALLPTSLRSRPIRLFAQQLALPLIARRWRADVLHSPSFIMPLYRGRQRHVLTVHDMSSFTMPEHHIPLRRSWPYRRAIVRSILHADAVVVISDATRQAICGIVPNVDRERLHVIPLGINDEFHVYSAERVATARMRHGWPSSYILYVGTIEPRKNLGRLVDSYAELVSSGDAPDRLLLAGKLGWGYEGLLRRLEEPDVKGRVQILGYVPQEELSLLYCGATLFVYPSRLEGFGFPPLEAMACGVPTISSLSSSLAENLQGAALLVPPDDGQALTQVMREALRNDELRAKFKEAGLQRAARFRWEATARRTLQCYELVAGGAG